MAAKDHQEIRICALVLDPYDTSPGQRFRIEQWEPYLAKNGIQIDYFSFTDERLRSVIYEDGRLLPKSAHMMRAFFRRTKHVLAAGNYDVVYLYRTASMAGPALLEKILKWKRVPIIFDFDDAIYLVNTSDANRKFGWLKFAGKTAEICRLSTAVTVGNSHLAEFARKYNPNVYIVPSSIDTEVYPDGTKSLGNGDKTVIGWTGSSTSQYHLEAFEPVLKKLFEKRGDEIELKVISNREPTGMKIPYRWSEWSSEKEVEETAEIDIGIMPTPDDEWTRGKCAMKALQYMSLGIPAICTDMGTNRDVIKQGENGFLAKTDEEWIGYFEKLIDDPKLRFEQGRKARRTVEEHYSMTKCAALFEAVVRKIVNAN